MNKLIIIGNLTRDPELKEVNGVPLCTFTVAVNRRVKSGAHPQADYLAKGRKVAVSGPVSAHAYIDSTGGPRAALEMRADDVEFLSARQQPDSDGFTPVPEDEVPQF